MRAPGATALNWSSSSNTESRQRSTADRLLSMTRILAVALWTVACTPEEVFITPTRIERESCTTRWVPCIASEDANGDGRQNPDEPWTGMCTAVDQCTPCDHRCATLVFLNQPANDAIGAPLAPLTVEVQDPAGGAILNILDDIAIDLDSPPAQVSAYGTLLAPINFGQATFTDVRISRVGVDLQLRATWPGAETAVSDPFTTTRACATGMTAYWPLNETTGSTFAPIAGASAAACTTCPIYDDSETAWHFERAASQGVSVVGGTDAPFHWSAGDDLAVELWLRADATACASGNEVIVGREVGDADPQQWWLGCRGNNRRLNSWWRDINDDGIGIEGPVVDTRWHHLVFQRQVTPPRRQLVVDGELVGASNVVLDAFDQPVAPDLNIGWLNLSGNYHYNGHVAHLALYHRTLPRSEIMAHRNLGRAVSYCDAVPPPCGDGQLDVGESCDDGNTVANDGCSPVCMRESRNCPADIISYWRLDGVGLNRFDDDVSGHHLACSFHDSARDGPRCSDATAGIIDGAQELDGSTMGFEVGAPAVAAFDWGPLDSFSVEVWMRAASGSTCAGNHVVVGRRQSTTYWWLGCAGSDGTARADLRDADAASGTTLSGPMVTDNAWHHLALTVDAVADTASLFVDGEHAQTIGIPFTSGFAMATNPVAIGLFDESYHFEGTVDAVAIYDRALHLAEITDHWALGVGADICTH